MFEIAFASVKSNLSRYVATLTAITIGVAFLAAGQMLVDSIDRSLGGEVDLVYANWDAVVAPKVSDHQEGIVRSFVSQQTVDAVAALPESGSVLPQFVSTVKLLSGVKEAGDDGVFGTRTLRLWSDVADLSPFQIEEGRAPSGPGELAIDRGLADSRKLNVGDTVKISGTTGPIDATLVGTSKSGTQDTIDVNGTLLIHESWVAAATGKPTLEYSQVAVRAAPGVDEQALATAISKVLETRLAVQRGSEFRDEQRQAFEGFSSTLSPVFTGFGYLALFVCAFVIFNTFSVIFTQRTRELALIRAIAATPGNISRSLIAEGALIGVAGAAIGVAAGVGLAFGLVELLDSLNLNLPRSDITISPWILAEAFFAGFIVTLVSSTLPAIRASRVSPVEAMREAAAESRAFPRVRVSIAAVLVAIGLLLIALTDSFLFGIGAFLFVIGAFLAGPAFALGYAKVAAGLIRSLGVPSRIAVDNIGRNPRRTSATVNALVVGVFLVTFVTIAGSSLKAYSVSQLDELATADFIISSDDGVLPDGFVSNVQAIDGIHAMAVVRSIPVRFDDHPDSISAAPPGALAAVGYKTIAGNLDELGDGVAASEFRQAGVPQIGDKLTYLRNDTGETVELPVKAVVQFSIENFNTGANYVSEATLDRLKPDAKPSQIFIRTETNKTDEVGIALNDLTEGISNLTASKGNFLGKIIGQVFDFLINSVNALLGMSVFIAMIGIVNTISLGIYERRHEFGLLRAVGMTARETRRMVRVEAMLIALLGTVLGMLIGGVLAYFALGLVDLGGVTVEWDRIAIVFAVGIGVGMVSAIWPPWKATRQDVLEALSVS